jgi:hypothetical protein
MTAVRACRGPMLFMLGCQGHLLLPRGLFRVCVGCLVDVEGPPTCLATARAMGKALAHKHAQHIQRGLQQAAKHPRDQ